MSLHNKTNRSTNRARRFESLEKREMFFIDALEDAWDTAKDVASDGADAIKDAAEWVVGAAETVAGAIDDVANGVANIGKPFTTSTAYSGLSTVTSSTGKQLRALIVEGHEGSDWVKLTQNGDKVTVVVSNKIDHIKKYSVKDFDIVLVKLQDGDDYLRNTTSLNVWAWGGKGNDTFFAGFSGSVRYMGEEGYDQLNVTDPSNPTRTSFPFAGKLMNLEGHPVYQHRVVLDGGDNADRIFGTESDDRLIGGGGGDAIYARGGSDLIFGDEGLDTVYGGDGNDTIYGGEGNDRLRGEQGVDRIYGELGEDHIDGGDDLVRDFLEGGSGKDTFFTRKGGMTDADILAELRDFSKYEGDTLKYHDLFFKFTDLDLMQRGYAELDGFTVTGKGNKKRLVPTSSFGMSNQTTPANPLPVLIDMSAPVTDSIPAPILIDMSAPQTPAPVIIDFGSLAPPTESVVDLNQATDIYIPMTTPVVESVTTNFGATANITPPVITNKSFLVKRSRL